MLYSLKKVYSKPLTVLIIAVIYFFIVVSTHEIVGEIVVAVFRNSSRAFYQTTVLMLGILFILFYIFYLVRKAYIVQHRNLIYWQLFTTLLLAMASFHLLIIHNIEIIHFLQYAIMALLLFPITKTLIGSIYWASLLGMIDEGYQYFILAPEKNMYFDFNDIILNTIGAAFGALFIFVHLKKIRNPIAAKWYKSDILMSLAFISLIVGLLFSVSIVQIYPNNEINNSIVLVKKMEPGFWSYIKHLNVKYHIVRPVEGTLITLLLFLLFGWFNYLAFKKNSYEQSI